MTTCAPEFTIGQTVRHCPELARDWHEGRAADGVMPAELGIGRVLSRSDDSGVCGLCDYHDRLCPGPWYVVDFGSRAGSEMYGAHELVPA
jgi:hypothetical protein